MEKSNAYTKLLLVTIAFLALTLPAGATPITGCTTINTPRVYELAANIISSTTCIQIQSSDVTLDGKGHSITGLGTTMETSMELTFINHQPH